VAYFKVDLSQNSSTRNEETTQNFAQVKQPVDEKPKTSPERMSADHSAVFHYLQARSGMILWNWSRLVSIVTVPTDKHKHLCISYSLALQQNYRQLKAITNILRARDSLYNNRSIIRWIKLHLAIPNVLKQLYNDLPARNCSYVHTPAQVP